MQQSISLSDRSRAVYKAWWHSYCKSLEERNLTPAQADARDIQRFVLGYPRNTAIRYFRLIAKIYEFASTHGLCTQDPAHGLTPQLYREEQAVPATATPERALEALYATPKPTKWRELRNTTLVLTLAEAGLRRSELLEAQWSDVQLNAWPARLFIAKRSMELPARLVPWLNSWREVYLAHGIKGNLLFPSQLDGGPLDPATAWRIVDRVLASVSAGKSDAGRTGPRALRTGFALRVSRDKNTSEVQRLLGHRLETSTIDLISRLEDPDASSQGEAPSDGNKE